MTDLEGHCYSQEPWFVASSGALLTISLLIWLSQGADAWDVSREMYGFVPSLSLMSGHPPTAYTIQTSCTIFHKTT